MGLRLIMNNHYDDVIMTMLASQITSLTVVYSIVYSGVNQRKHQSSASLAIVREIHRGPVNFPHKWPVTRKMFPFDDVIMISPLSHVPMFSQCKLANSEPWLYRLHGWPLITQPGSLHPALQRKYTQPCSLFSRGTAVWTMGARLCLQWGTYSFEPSSRQTFHGGDFLEISK